MKKINKILSVVLCLAMVLSMAAFTVSAESENATISFADVANRTSVSTEQQVWEQNGITVTNDKAGSTSNVADYSNPVRFYKNSSVTIAYPDMAQITVNCNSASYATALVNSISDANATVTVADKAVTIVFANAVDSFVVAALSAQIRVDSITVYTGEVPEEPIEPEVPTGLKAERVDVLNDGDKVYIYYPDSALAIANVASGNRLSGVDATMMDDYLYISEGAAEMTVSIDENGYYTFICEGMYLTSGETGNSLRFEAEANDYSLWVSEEAENGWFVKNVNAVYKGKPQYLEYYNGFTTYSMNANNVAAYTFQFFQAHVCDFEAVVTAPTCTADGYTTYTCACGESYVGDQVPAGHSFADGFCTVCGAQDPDFVPEEPPVTDGPEDVTITIGDKSYTTVDGKFLYNEDVTMANCTNYNMILLDKDFSGIVETNGWGVAIVLGKDGTLLRVYDGANGGYWTAEGKAPSAHFTGQDFAAVAWSELQADELLIIFTNGGSAGNQARQFGSNVRSLCGQTATMQGFIWIEEEEITCQHTNTTIEGAADATCTENGFSGNTVCADCGMTVIEGNEIAALGHAYVDGFCTVCGSEQPPCVHEPVLEGKVDATCVINGYTGDLVCAVCGETIEVGSVVEATGHSYVEGACTVCGESDPDYHPQDHKVQIVVIAPTCTQWGCTLHICTEDDCNKSWTTDYVAAIGHAWVAPTCTEAGYCANCGEAGEAALGHAWVAPTCTEDGYCANCNAAGEAALGHDMIGGENQAPTCTEPGFKSHVCTRCDYSESYETPAMGHVWLDATCICAKTCANCGEKDGEALPHNWNYSVVKEPTCTEQGINKMSCPDCGMVQSYPVAALEHTEEILPAKAPTCTEPGLSEGKKCSVCGEILVAQEEIPVLEHTAGEWVIVKEATETETGLKQQVCTACGKVLAEEVIPVIENQGPADTGNGVVYLFVLAAMAAMSGAAIAVCRKKYF